MKKVLVLLVFSLLLIDSCTKKPAGTDPICDLVFKTTTSAANTLATTLECQNPGAIAASLSGLILKVGLCETTAQSSLSDMICPQLSTFVAGLATSPIPAEWQCSATTITDIIKTQVAETCVKVIK